MAKKEENSEKRFVLRLPVNLWGKVIKQAKTNRRSMNSEIIQVINDNVNHLTELQLVEKINDMCTQSLDPATFEMWEQVKDLLFHNRKFLKGKAILGK